MSASFCSVVSCCCIKSVSCLSGEAVLMERFKSPLLCWLKYLYSAARRLRSACASKRCSSIFVTTSLGPGETIASIAWRFKFACSSSASPWSLRTSSCWRANSFSMTSVGLGRSSDTATGGAGLSAARVNVSPRMAMSRSATAAEMIQGVDLYFAII